MTTNFLKTSSYALLAGLMQQGLALGHFLLAVRWLAPDALGTWAMLLTLTSFVEMARLGLVQNALVHFGAHHLTERPKIFAAAFVLSLAVSLAGVGLLVLTAELLRGAWQMPDLPTLLLLYVPMALLNAVLRFADGVRMLQHDFRTALWSAVAFGTTYLGATIFFKTYLGDVTPSFLLVLQLPSAFVALIVAWHLGLKTIIWGKITRFWLQKIIAYGRFGMGTNLCSMLFQRADMLLLGGFVPPAALAVYTVATRIIGYLDFPLNNLGLALFPRLAAENRTSGTEGVVRLYEKSVGWLLALTLPMTIGATLGAGWLVWLIAGHRFDAAIPIVQILALAGLVKPWGRVFGVTLDAVGKPQWNFRMLLMSMIVTIVFNIILIPPFGIVGAAVATSAAIITTIGIGQILLQRWLPVRAWLAWTHVLPTYRQVSGRLLLFLKIEKPTILTPSKN